MFSAKIEASKFHNNVNEMTSSWVFADNEIKGVGDGWAVDCSPAVSSWCSGCSSQSVTAACMRFRWWHLVRIRRQKISGDHCGGGCRRFAFRIIPTPLIAAAMLAACFLGNKQQKIFCNLGGRRSQLILAAGYFDGSAWQSPFHISQNTDTLIATATSCMDGLDFADIHEIDPILQPVISLHGCCQFQRWLRMSVFCDMRNGEIAICEMYCEMNKQYYRYSAKFLRNTV